MRFASDSSALVITAGFSADETYNVIIIRLSNGEAFAEASFTIKSEGEHTVDEAKQVDVCLAQKEFYIICGAERRLKMYSYDFTGELKHAVPEARAVAVSPSQKALALGHADKIYIRHIESDT